MADQTSKTTTDHDTIRRWAEEHDAVPATARGTQEGDGSAGVLTLDVVGFGADETDLEHIGWDEWLEKFESSDLAFLYQDEKKDGEDSTFFKLVSRD